LLSLQLWLLLLTQSMNTARDLDRPRQTAGSTWLLRTSVAAARSLGTPSTLSPMPLSALEASSNARLTWLRPQALPLDQALQAQESQAPARLQLPQSQWRLILSTFWPKPIQDSYPHFSRES
jgi:hypothetical protein